VGVGVGRGGGFLPGGDVGFLPDGNTAAPAHPHAPALSEGLMMG
jgi:hypothetical protein